MITLSPATTALVLVDLQKGIVGLPGLSPREGGEVLANAAALAKRFRAAGASVALINVDFAADGGDVLLQPVDNPPPSPPGGFPTDWAQFPQGLAEPSDIRVTKHQWGAFYGTDLDVQMRRRGVKTIVLGGIATNIGVESTARQAHEHGYDVVVVEDITTSFAKEMHEFATNAIFPMLSRVVISDNIRLEEDRTS